MKKEKNISLIGNNVELKVLTKHIMSKNYIHWLNDKDINIYLETKGNDYTTKDLLDYVNNMYKSNNNYLFGIFYDNSHVGNIKLGNINFLHKRADIGLLIGEKKYWGRGFASETIYLITSFAFRELKLQKVFAGIYSNNIGSIKAFEKNGFKQCALLKNHAWCENKFVNVLMFEKLNKSFKIE